MKYRFGVNSLRHLRTADERLQRIAWRALRYGVFDFSVIEGHRSVKEQRRLYDEGKSQIDGVSVIGRHNARPSLAIDILPYPRVVNGINVWRDRQRFCVLAGLMFAAAAEELKNESGELRWGGDWDGDGNNADSTFHDLPHFELTGVSHE